MDKPFSADTTREQLEANLAGDHAAQVIDLSPDTNPSGNGELVEREKNGQFVTGHRPLITDKTGNKTRGIIAIIKAATNDYATLVDNLIKVSQGKTVHGHKTSLKDIMDATNSLLDRAIGKPTQQIYHTSDDETKELMANRVRLRVLEQEAKAAKRKDVTGKTVIEHKDARVTAIGTLRGKDV